MKSNEQLLKDFIKSNKQRRADLAIKAGFKTVEEYRKSLETKKELSYGEFRQLAPLQQRAIAKSAGYSTVSGYLTFLRAKFNIKTPTTSILVNKPVEKPVIYNVIILDQSGSMQGQKYNNAVKGIHEEISMLKKEQGVDVKIAIVGFSDYVSTFQVTSLDKAFIPSASFNTTALNDAIGETLNNLIKTKQPSEKAVVKIFTDGQENSSRNYTALDIRKHISQVETQGVTVTFIGTKEDVMLATKKYSLSDGNTFAYENNAQGVQTAFRKMSESTITYSQSVAAGASDEDLRTGFFTKTVGTL